MGYSLFKIYFILKEHINNDDLYSLANVLAEEGVIYYDLFHKSSSLKEEIYKVKLGFSSLNFKFTNLENIELDLACQNDKNDSGFVIVSIPIITNFIKNYKKLEPILISIVKKFLNRIYRGRKFFQLSAGQSC